jgi:hypothetical protein
MIKDIQLAFIQQIERKIGGEKVLAAELSSTLGISKSEAYGKVNGNSLLTTTQILNLCDAYGVDFNIVREKGRSSAKVGFIPFHAIDYSLHDYVRSLETFLVSLDKTSNKKITCATDDIPIFHMFKYPELTAFKLHFWNLRVENNPNIIFNFSEFDQSVLETASQLHQLYTNIPSSEIWSNQLSLNTIEQIRYAAENDLFANKKTGKLICNQLTSTIKDVEEYAMRGNKAGSEASSFEWYFYNVIGGITYLAETDNTKTAFIRFNTFNNLQVENGPLCEEVTHWLDQLKQDSTGFSKQGSVQRNRYLKKTYESFDQLHKLFE